MAIWWSGVCILLFALSYAVCILAEFFYGGSMEEEEKVVKGDDVIVELEATLEDLYMGGSMKPMQEDELKLGWVISQEVTL